jgi:hypothetical protein
MAARTGAIMMQDWVGSDSPKLADMCDRVPGLVDVLADIVTGIELYCQEYGVEPEEFRPECTVMPDGKIVVDLNPPGG